MKKTLFLIIILNFSSCSFFKEDNENDLFDSKTSSESKRDYWDHWKKISADFLENYKKELSPPPPYINDYLKNILSNIEKRNEVFFEKDPKTEIKFYIFNDKRPFYFSLPSGEIILSRRLVEKYIDHEGILLAILVPEYIRIRKVLYQKIRRIPLGFIDLDKTLSLQRLGFENRMKLHQWSYYLLLRTNYHPGQYLSWIQIQNRNHIDFSFYLADSILLLKEESYLKQFIINNYGKLDLNPLKLKSSPAFYKFIDKYRRIL